MNASAEAVPDVETTSERANERLRFLASQGQTALSVAFDLPTQFGYDSGDQVVAHEVGRAGVAIDTASDVCDLFAGIPLDQVSVNFPVNATAPIILAAHLVAAERSGVPYRALTGTLQSDVLAEFLGRGACLFPPGPSLRLITDVVEFGSRELPRFSLISITGCPGLGVSCDAGTELALAMASAIAYCDAFLARGLSFEAFAPRLSFRFAAARGLAEEAAKLRAARRIWHRVATERLGATSPAAARLRFFSGSPGTAAAAHHPPHTGAGPAGSCCVEPLADEIETRASALLAELDALGGAASAPAPWSAIQRCGTPASIAATAPPSASSSASSALALVSISSASGSTQHEPAGPAPVCGG